MKKIYGNVELEIVFFFQEDIVRTSNVIDNVEDMENYPENNDFNP